jgi:hypothetical protein
MDLYTSEQGSVAGSGLNVTRQEGLRSMHFVFVCVEHDFQNKQWLILWTELAVCCLQLRMCLVWGRNSRFKIFVIILSQGQAGEVREPWNKALLFKIPEKRERERGGGWIGHKITVTLWQYKYQKRWPTNAETCYRSASKVQSISFLYTCEPYSNLDGPLASRRWRRHNLRTRDVFGNATSPSHVWRGL